MQFVNLTPHSLDIIVNSDSDGFTITALGVRKIERGDLIARLDETREEVGEVDGISVTRPTYGDPYTIDADGNRGPFPEPEEGVAYVVSGMMLNHPDIAERDDVYAPGPLVREQDEAILSVDDVENILDAINNMANITEDQHRHVTRALNALTRPQSRIVGCKGLSAPPRK